MGRSVKLARITVLRPESKRDAVQAQRSPLAWLHAEVAADRLTPTPSAWVQEPDDARETKAQPRANGLSPSRQT